MENTKKAPRPPDYTNDGIAVWENTNEKGEKYLSIAIVGHKTLYAYPRKEK